MFVHCPNFIEPVLITLLEALKLILKLLELLGELFVIVGKFNIVSLEILALAIELLLDCTQYVLISSLLCFQRIDCHTIDLFTFLEYLIVEFEFLLIQSIYGLHVLHAPFEYLHFLLQLYLLFSLIIGVLRPQVFELFSVVLLVLGPLLLELFLCPPVVLEQLPYLVFVALEDLRPLVVEGLLDVVQLVAVVSPHLRKLKLHARDEQVDVVVLLLEGSYILLVLKFKLAHELLD